MKQHYLKKGDALCLTAGESCEVYVNDLGGRVDVDVMSLAEAKRADAARLLKEADELERGS